MRNWKQLVALLSIILITLVALSPILTVIADGPPPPPNGDGPPPPPPNGGGGAPSPYETPASIYYAIGVVAVIAIVAVVYIGLKGGTKAPQRPRGPPQ